MWMKVKFPPTRVSEAIRKYGIDLEKPNPLEI